MGALTTGELHLHWEIREGSLEEVILCDGASKMSGRLSQKQREGFGVGGVVNRRARHLRS